MAAGMMPAVSSPLRLKIERLDKRIDKLASEREQLVRQFAAEQGFQVCDDCFNGYCSMNCSSAPMYMKVLI